MAECARQVTPRAAGASNPQHRLHEQPVILAAAPGIARLAKTQRLYFRPLGVCQNESVHPELESQPRSDENPESRIPTGPSPSRELGKYLADLIVVD
jgi:hypothetical protein